MVEVASAVEAVSAAEGSLEVETALPADRTFQAEGAAPAAPLRWSVLVDQPLDGARNMARDHALATARAGGSAVLRIYRWAQPTVSFGRNEPAAGRYDPHAAARAGFAFVRRPTGGRAVLHDRELTYSVALPVHAFGGPRGAYAAVNAGLVRALRTLGVRAELAAPGARAAPVGAGPCFQRAAGGEVTVQGHKLVGSAQVRVGDTLLQHGSLLLGPGQERLNGLRRDGFVDGDGEAPVSLAELVENPPRWEALVEAVRSGLAARLGGDWPEGAAQVDPVFEAAMLDRYASDAWTWRR